MKLLVGTYNPKLGMAQCRLKSKVCKGYVESSLHVCYLGFCAFKVLESIHFCLDDKAMAPLKMKVGN